MWAESLAYAQNFSNTEIESSVGVLGESGSFVPGLNFASFQNLYNGMEKATFWSKKIPKHILIDYIFPNNIRGRYFGGTKSPEFVHKQTVKSILFRVDDDSLGRAVRLKVSRENPHDHIYTKPLSVKLTERWSFLHVDTKGITWRYDLNKTVRGANKEEACEMQPCFTVEIEISSPAACSETFRERTLDLLGRFTKEGQLLDKQPALGKLVKVYTLAS
jgi:hypothetical protein